MKRIRIEGAGGPAGVGITRCLKESYEVVGYDDSVWASLMMECPNSLDQGDLSIPVPDILVANFAKKYPKKTFLPPVSHIKICQDKALTAEALEDLAPKTYWVRDTVGAGGKGAQMASEYLPGRNVSFEAVFIGLGMYNDWFMKERLSYRVGSIAPVNGIGTSAVSICINDEDAKEVAVHALENIEEYTGEQLYGVYSVDLKQAEDGTFKVTEINAGRFLTASYPYFYTTGYNLPLRMAQVFLKDTLSPLPDYPEGWGLVWQLGQDPRLFPPEVTKEWK